jgi:hypothetical protein
MTQARHDLGQKLSGPDELAWIQIWFHATPKKKRRKAPLDQVSTTSVAQIAIAW